MGSQVCGTLAAKSNIFKRPQLKIKNVYLSTANETCDNYNQFFISQDICKKYSHLLEEIEKQKKSYFQDKNFQIKPQSTKLSQLHNYGRMKAVIYQKKGQQLFNFFQQNQLQFSYLSCVLLFLSENRFLLNRIFLTPNLNKYDLYILQLFCYGQFCDVVIDDFLPTNIQALLFSKIVRGKQIWPILIQKAWCKQIGSYKNAKGLSPQDCFEQITGIPAYSYEIMKKDAQKQITRQHQQNSLIAFIARNNLNDLKSRHVFYLEKIKGDIFWIRSPFNQYIFNQHQIEDSNLVKVNWREIENHFQFYTIGYFRANYQPYSIVHISHKNQQKIYQLKVMKDQLINIRFIQLYQGYFDQESKAGYDYSSVFIELYNQNKILLDDCQGCHRSNQGQDLTSQIFSRLTRGIYYLKISADWKNEAQLNEGKIVVYSSRNNIQIKPCQEKIEQMLPQLNDATLKNKTKVEPIKVGDHVLVCYMEKANGLLIKIINEGKEDQDLKIDLSKCVNVRVKNSSLQQTRLIKLKLKPSLSHFIELLPLDPRSHMEIKDFQVTKL